MKVLLAGPLDAHELARSLDSNAKSLPQGYGYSPLNALAPGLHDLGVEVELVTLDPLIDAPQSHQVGPFRLIFCPVRGAPRFRARTRARDLFAKEIAHLRNVMAASSCDLIHAHWTYEFAEAALRCNKPHLITMHDVGWDCLRLYRDAYRAMRLVMKYRVMPRARAVSAVSPYVAERAWHYGHFRRPTVIANPIAQAPASLRSLKDPVLVTAGSAARLKNVDASVAAFREIKARFPDASLHLFGPGLDRAGRFGNAGDGVICHGEVAHAELMRFLDDRATLLIHPSRKETFGLIIGEAKMRGIPVIAGLHSGGVGHVVGNVGGVLVDVTRPDQIAAAAIAMLGTPQDYHAMQKAAHEDAMHRFGIAQVSGEYRTLYAAILQAEK